MLGECDDAGCEFRAAAVKKIDFVTHLRPHDRGQVASLVAGQECSIGDDRRADKKTLRHSRGGKLDRIVQVAERFYRWLKGYAPVSRPVPAGPPCLAWWACGRGSGLVPPYEKRPMYQSYWGLQHSPFASAASRPDLAASPVYTEALARLEFLRESRCPFGLLLGFSNSGKSTEISAFSARVVGWQAFVAV